MANRDGSSGKGVLLDSRLEYGEGPLKAVLIAQVLGQQTVGNLWHRNLRLLFADGL